MTSKDTSFTQWLDNQIVHSGISHRQFARNAGISHAQLINVLNGQRGMGRDFLNAVARGLNMPPDTIFRMAGFLPPLPGTEQDHVLGEILEVAKNLSEADRVEVLDYALHRYQRQTGGERRDIVLSKETPLPPTIRLPDGPRPPPVLSSVTPTLDEEIESFLANFPELTGIMDEARHGGLGNQAIRSIISNVYLVTSSPEEMVSFRRFYGELLRMLEKIAKAA